MVMNPIDPENEYGQNSSKQTAGRSGHNQALSVPAAQDTVPRAESVSLSNEISDGGYSNEVNVWEYLEVISRRRWTVTAVFAVCVLTALIYSFAARPMYTATALIKIQPGGLNVVDFDAIQESAAQSQAYSDYFQTQYEILSSRTLARRTIDALDLGENPFLNGEAEAATPLGRAKGFVRAILPTRASTDPAIRELETEQLMIDRFLDRVDIHPRRKSFLVELAFTSPNAELSREVALAMSNEYIDLTLDQGVAAAAQARGFIKKQLSKVKGALEHSEHELQEFARGNDIVAHEQEERVIDERLGDLNTRFTEAEAERIELRALYDQTFSDQRTELAAVADSPLVQSLREELARTQTERAEIGARFTSEYPEVKRLDARITQLHGEIEAEQARVLSSIRTDYERALEREQLFGQKLVEQKGLVAEYEEKAVAFKIHQREVDTNRAIYEDLLRRMKEVEVAEAIRASNINLVDLPETPLDPSSPVLPVNLALALVLGLVGGIATAFLQEFVDDSLKTPDDVERYLRLATLGMIPEFDSPLNDDLADEAPDLEVKHQPASAGSEAIRTLRASLFLAAPGGLPTSLLMTSARPSEGKTCISVNLAASLAQMGRRVCLVDCDLRRPRVNKALAMSLSPGVTNFLTGSMALDDVVRQTIQPGFDVLTAGPIPPNPVDLLNSANMNSLLRQLEERYDHVLVDAPPALGFADVPILSHQLGGGCLLVTRSGETSRRLAKHACDYLTRMQSKLLGVVLNRVATSRSGYSYYGYYGHYGEYYTQRVEDESLDNFEATAS